MTTRGPVLITMAEFKRRMLTTYASPQDAFAALHLKPKDLWKPGSNTAQDATPMRMDEFIRGSETFEPPLTPQQAQYAFKGLDTNNDDFLELREFTAGLLCGHFFRGTDQQRAACDDPAVAAAAMSTSTVPSQEQTITPLVAGQTTLPAMVSTTSSGAGASGAGSSGSGRAAAPITMAEFKDRMLKTYASPEEAFAALDASPSGLDEFIRLTKTFEPPLTKGQAEYAFQSLDADHDGVLPSFEFLGSLAFKRFGEGLGAHSPQSTTMPETQSGLRRGVLAIIVFASFSSLLLVFTFLVTRIFCCHHRNGERLKTYTSLGARVKLAAEAVTPRDGLPAIEYGLLHQPHPSCEVQLLGHGPVSATSRMVSVPSAWGRTAIGGRRSTSTMVQL